MPHRLHVATRKGLLSFAEQGDGWALVGSAFLGEPVSAVLADRRDGALYAALNLGHFGVKLHRSDDGGASWAEQAAPAFAADEPGSDGQPGPSVAMIWTLAEAGDDRPGTILAGTLPGALFLSADRGASWTLNRGLWDQPSRPHWSGGGYDLSGLHSISVDPRDSNRIAIGISTAGVWQTTDGGHSWALGTGLRAAYMPPDQAYDPVSQDPHRLSRCQAAPDVIWCQHHNGIFRSVDGGASFIELTAEAPSHFGFAVVADPRRADRAWFVPGVKDECRIPVDTRLVVTRAEDGGARFTVWQSGLPREPSFDLIYRHGLDITADGGLLAMGSTTGNLWVGREEGTRWQTVAGHLPPIYQVAWAAG